MKVCVQLLIFLTANLPTQTELGGLFTSDGARRALLISVKNPYTGVVYANGQVPLNDPNIDPVALTAFKLLPTPNIPGAALTANNFQSLPATTDFENKGDGRADFVINPRQNGFFRYSERSASTFQPPNIPGLAGGNSAGTIMHTLVSSPRVTTGFYRPHRCWSSASVKHGHKAGKHLH